MGNQEDRATLLHTSIIIQLALVRPVLRSQNTREFTGYGLSIISTAPICRSLRTRVVLRVARAAIVGCAEPDAWMKWSHRPRKHVPLVRPLLLRSEWRETGERPPRNWRAGVLRVKEGLYQAIDDKSVGCSRQYTACTWWL